MNLEKEFAPYQESLELKELGFNELCLGMYCIEYYSPNNEIKLTFDDGIVNNIIGIQDGTFTLAPTFSQAFRWFRENGYEAFPKKTENNEYYYTIEYGHWTFIMDDRYNSYEEAEIACLKQLIRMLKSNNNSRK